MSFEAMLNHTCDIYHIRRADASPGYGLPASPTFSYPDTPDIAGLACHFDVKSRVNARSVHQLQPQAVFEAQIKLSVPFDTDIRLNDRVIDLATGYEYTAGIPINVRAHHKIVMLCRTSAQKPL